MRRCDTLDLTTEVATTSCDEDRFPDFPESGDERRIKAGPTLPRAGRVGGANLRHRAFGDPMSAGPSSERQVEGIGGRVRRLRTEKGLSQDRLALEAHVDQSGLSKFERGNRGLGKVPLARIARVLDVSLEELVAGTDFQVGAQDEG